MSDSVAVRNNILFGQNITDITILNGTEEQKRSEKDRSK